MASPSDDRRKAILVTTLRLLNSSLENSLSVKNISMDRIAKEAGVSKATIYGWWPTKTAVIIDSFLDSHIARTPVPKNVSAIDALREHYITLVDAYAAQEGKLIAQLIAECQSDADIRADFKQRFWHPRLAIATHLIDRAIAEGDLRGDITAEAIGELLYTPLYLRLLMQTGPLTQTWATSLFQAALTGLRP